MKSSIRPVVPQRKEQKRDHWVLHFLKKFQKQAFWGSDGTACMLLSSPGTTAASERGVGQFCNSLTPFRTINVD
jgi:hypothetical protein